MVLSVRVISRLAPRIKAYILMPLILVGFFRCLGWTGDRLSRKDDGQNIE
jgi:hypothetical protein